MILLAILIAWYFLILEAMHKYDVRCNSERGNIALQLLIITRGRTYCIYLAAPLRFYHQHRKTIYYITAMIKDIFGKEI